MKLLKSIMKYKKIILIFVFLLVLFSQSLILGTIKNTVVLDNGLETIEINVEIADEREERAKGLMFRKFLEKNSGMLFVFDNEDYHSFWMKNTLIPLDMIFISESFEIVDIIYATPCLEDPCRSYKPARKAKYVLEVNGNFTAKNGIKTGNKAIINENYYKNGDN